MRIDMITRGRFLLALFVIGLMVVPGRGVRFAWAQTISYAQLGSASLGVSDLPGFHLQSEDYPAEAGYDVTFQRIFAADDPAATGGAALFVLMLVPGASLSRDEASSRVGSGDLFSRWTDAINLRLLGSRGVGEVDQSAVWNESDAAGGVQNTLYGESFLQGNVVVIVAYGTRGDFADTSNQSAAYAFLQDAKLLASTGLPAAMLHGPAPVSTLPDGVPPLPSLPSLPAPSPTAADPSLASPMPIPPAQPPRGTTP
ncbi:MAG: hypothetical protein ACR2HB_11710 [Dehalococcoidia bacterium]